MRERKYSDATGAEDLTALEEMSRGEKGYVKYGWKRERVFDQVSLNFP